MQALHCLVAEWACLRTHRINGVSNVVGLAEIVNVNLFLHSWTTSQSVGPAVLFLVMAH